MDRSSFKTEFFEGAELVGKFGFPKVRGTNLIPEKAIPFNMAMREKNRRDKWVHFFIDDYRFERIWNQPQRYISVLNKFVGVISTDFSMFSDMPKAQVIWNCYRNRAAAFWLQKNHIPVIPVVEWSDYTDFAWCLDGLPIHSTLAVGTYGCNKSSLKRYGLIKGVEKICAELQPSALVMYGDEVPGINSLCKKVVWIENYCNFMRKRI